MNSIKERFQLLKLGTKLSLLDDKIPQHLRSHYEILTKEIHHLLDTFDHQQAHNTIFIHIQSSNGSIFQYESKYKDLIRFKTDIVVEKRDTLLSISGPHINKGNLFLLLSLKPSGSQMIRKRYICSSSLSFDEFVKLKQTPLYVSESVQKFENGESLEMKKAMCIFKFDSNARIDDTDLNSNAIIS